MKFSVIHPTARVCTSLLNWADAMFQWQRTCDNPQDVEYIVIVHESRIGAFWGCFGDDQAIGHDNPGEWGRFVVVVNHLRDCVVDQVNEGLKAATGEIIIGTMDDLFAPQGWDTKLSACCPDTSQAIALHCLTGSPRDNEIFNPSCDTKVLRDLKGPISPEYESMFVDNEDTLQSRKLGKVIETGLVFEHRHPIFGAPADEIHALQNRKEAYEVGKRTFEKRRAQGFPRVDLPGFPKPQGLGDKLLASLPGCAASKPRIAFCTPGETFSMEWVSRVRTLDSYLANLGYEVMPYNRFSTNVYSVRVGITKDVIANAQAGIFKPDYVLWLDDDNLLLPEQACRLIEFLDSHLDADGVSGWCWLRKHDRWSVSAGLFSDDLRHLNTFNLDQLFKGGTDPKPMQCGGFPCFLVRYSVLEALGPRAFFPWLCEDDPDWYGPEDLGFFRKAFDAGFKFFVDPGCKVGHLKTALQEPDIPLYGDTPQALKDLRKQLNGDPVSLPVELQSVM